MLFISFLSSSQQKSKGKRVPTIKALFQVTNKQSFKEVAENTILQLEVSKSKSTIDNYRTALRQFLLYTGPGITVRSIDNVLVEGFQRRLHDRGICLNTISCYMRSLRSLLNIIDPKGNWQEVFKNVFTGNAKTTKRAISPEDICRLQQTDLKRHPRLRFFRDMFIFCFYALGMPFVDLAFLRRSQIKDGYIEYSRRKTGQPIRVKIEKPMQDIMNRYARKGSRYVFPILTQEDPRQAMREYETALRCYNYTLKRLEGIAHIPHITSYVARHSWASMANESGIGLPVISKALGHTNMQTTIIYLRDVQAHRVDDSNAAVIKQINEIMAQMKGKEQKN